MVVCKGSGSLRECVTTARGQRPNISSSDHRTDAFAPPSNDTDGRCRPDKLPKRTIFEHMRLDMPKRLVGLGKFIDRISEDLRKHRRPRGELTDPNCVFRRDA